ncbi:DUF418 domain-containing protein [Aurantiacibacter aquimixticola]|uniref:DUF418 domain-containing protein n=1 Tax=Aurantiacibacter aquimixticola TaxID=1958945 RepID=A0A419RTJ5_9SPHN|nr:DUF418 domain-containing protein [Aurantiacibacter aquimixticola]RJY09113.1 DUF418 domain-containing protein [Aurantiacibacter aquimixticola]
MTDQQATPDTPRGAEPAPAKPKERIASLDLIRGIAVLGILGANIVAFGQPFTAYMWPDAWIGPTGDPDNWLWVAQFVLIDGKMRGLFTLLFGAGLALFMDKAWERGASRALQARRLAWLLVFGLIHFFFIWRGDILFLYSVSGFVAMAFLRWSARNLLVIGLLGYVMAGFAFVLFMGFPYLLADTALGQDPKMAEATAGLTEAKQDVGRDDALEREVLTDGSYIDFVTHQFSEHLTDPLISLSTFMFETLPLMLIGMGLYRAGLFGGGLNARKQAIWGWLGVIVGSALTLLIALAMRDGGLTYWGTIAAFTGFTHHVRLPVVLGLAALLALYGAHASGWLAERLSAAGRAAFTNYLGTSVLMMLVFHPWAGGLWGELTRPELYLVVLFGWAVMLGWSKPWLERFRYGPLEWLWRCLTYWRFFPLKR